MANPTEAGQARAIAATAWRDAETARALPYGGRWASKAAEAAATAGALAATVDASADPARIVEWIRLWAGAAEIALWAADARQEWTNDPSEYSKARASNAADVAELVWAQVEEAIA